MTAKLRLGRSLRPDEYIARGQGSGTGSEGEGEGEERQCRPEEAIRHSAVSIPLIATNRINDPAVAEEVLARGQWHAAVAV